MIFGNPPIVTNGLVLHLDAGSRKSYVSGSTVWSDLSGNINNGTLSGSALPTFDSANQGSIVFNGTSNYVNLGQTNSLLTFGTNPFTIDLTIKHTASSANRIVYTNYNNYNTGFASYFAILQLVSGTDYNIGYLDSNGGSISTPVLLSINEIANVVYTRSGTSNIAYKNGIQVSTRAQNNNYSGSLRDVLIGGNVTGINSFPGSIYTVKQYNRALSSTEVAQNYNALKSRFGLS